ncbi:DUF1801 domain-containing protein [Glaciecola petra]|uniref:DUF1801 domain-containing protein n=1 Tax=Glaciecola petra TaxID=3075602 RepID=A0ABU2ZNH9_9ALTE|nr:DUF1801 domain-containing protein [Aestuariibacter sp. P117]MDT0594183.1 DUF1801 domain-containing protein [Aestuariibacter sp. P117]
MSTLKTRVNDESVKAYIDSLVHPTRKQDALILLEVYSRVTGQSPKMWGTSIIGFGDYSYENSSKKRQTWSRAAFSPRKNYMSLYLMLGVLKHPEKLAGLGKFKHGKSCLNINKLADVDMKTLEELVALDWSCMNEKYP